MADGVTVRAQGGGGKAGPGPADRAEEGGKHGLVIDEDGVPLEIHVTGADVGDHRRVAPSAEAFLEIGGPTSYADAGYDGDPDRDPPRRPGIDPVIRREGTSHGSGLGEVRRAAERSIAWIERVDQGTAAATRPPWPPGDLHRRLGHKDIGPAARQDGGSLPVSNARTQPTPLPRFRVN